MRFHPSANVGFSLPSLLPAHSRAIEGVGLGLSVSREIARSHGGDLALGDAPPGEVRFVLSLPVRAAK